MILKYGKQPARHDINRLLMSKYMTDALPDPPEAVNHSRGIVSWGMLLNGPNTYGHGVPADGIGCCAYAKVEHAIQSLVMSQILPSVKPGIIGPDESRVLHYYEKWAGYDPSDPSTDQGEVLVRQLNRWRKEAFSGYELLGYGDVSPRNTRRVKQAIDIFGGLDVGLQMPDVWQPGDDVWDMPSGYRGATEGHDVWVHDYDEETVSCVTWGVVQRISWDGFMWACDEAHALLIPDFKPPYGFDFETWKSDLSLVTG